MSPWRFYNFLHYLRLLYTQSFECIFVVVCLICRENAFFFFFVGQRCDIYIKIKIDVVLQMSPLNFYYFDTLAHEVTDEAIRCRFQNYPLFPILGSFPATVT